MHCREYSCILQQQMMTDLTNNTFVHFTNMQDHLEKYLNFVFQTEKYVTEIWCYPRFRK
jgi:hypothetical protein